MIFWEVPCLKPITWSLGFIRNMLLLYQKRIKKSWNYSGQTKKDLSSGGSVLLIDLIFVQQLAVDLPWRSVFSWTDTKILRNIERAKTFKSLCESFITFSNLKVFFISFILNVFPVLGQVTFHNSYIRSYRTASKASPPVQARTSRTSPVLPWSSPDSSNRPL